jgi:hypothetical protein
MQSLKQANTDAMKQAEAASKYGTLQQVNGQYQYVSYPGTPSVHTANNQLSNQYNNQYVQIGPAPQFEMSSYDGTQLGMHLGPDGKTMIDDTTGNPVTSISKDGQGHQYSSNFIHSGTVTTSTVIAYATPLYRWYQPPGGG